MDQVVSSATQRVVDAARGVGVDVDVRTFPEGTRTAEDAAAAIGCPVGAIAKTLVLHDDVGPLLVLASGSNRVDYEKVAAALGTSGVRRATPDEARRATGYAIGGTAPFGHPEPLRTLLDVDLLDHDPVWAAGGTPATVFPIAPDLLARTTGARTVDVAARSEGL